jgi:hypothetical protein
VSHGVGVKMEQAKDAKVISSTKGKISFSFRASSSVSKKKLLRTVRNDGVVLTKNVNAT